MYEHFLNLNCWVGFNRYLLVIYLQRKRKGSHSLNCNKQYDGDDYVDFDDNNDDKDARTIKVIFISI